MIPRHHRYPYAPLANTPQWLRVRLARNALGEALREMQEQFPCLFARTPAAPRDDTQPPEPHHDTPETAERPTA